LNTHESRDEYFQLLTAENTGRYLSSLATLANIHGPEHRNIFSYFATKINNHVFLTFTINISTAIDFHSSVLQPIFHQVNEITVLSL